MKILIIRFSSVGDLVTLEPVFRAYRHFLKEVSITLLTSKIGQSLYNDTNYFDEIIVDRGFLTTLKELRHSQYDVVINLQCTRRSHWFTLLSNKDKLINSSSSMIQKYLYQKVMPKTHSQILKMLGYNEKIVDEYFQETQMIRLPYDRIDFGLQEGKKIIALAPGASERWLSKKWGDDNFSELAKILIKQGYEVILIGSSLEYDAGQIIEKENPIVHNFIGTTSLQELKSLLSQVDLLVGNDSGPVHIAAGVGTNTLTIFGPISYKYCVKFGSGYSGNHDYIVSDQYDCIPCHKSKCIKNHECMRTISPEMVSEKVKNLI